jgi:nicotinate-nucleotide adenylyltransferase
VRTGILGGTFNPPHIAHLVCAEEAAGRIGLARVLLIPARVPPHKAVPDDPGIEHRLEMCRLAVAGNDRLEVSDLEAARPGPSYTIDTLQELHRANPDKELFLIVGGDVASGFADWREPERVLSLATLAVAARPGTSRGAVEQALGAVEGGERTVFFDMPEIGVSSTMLRERVRAGAPTRYLMPDAVRAYADRHRLYEDSRGS